MSRTAHRSRATKETSIEISIDLDGDGTTDVTTGIPFYDHMLDQLGRHGGFDLTVRAEGDLHIDTHHTVEDVAIALGETFREALGDKAGVRRFASGRFPLDEALVDVALDLSGRAHVEWFVPDARGAPARQPAVRPAARGTRRDVVRRRRRDHAARRARSRAQRAPHHRSHVQGARAVAPRCRPGRGKRWGSVDEGRAVTDGSRPLVAVLDYGIGNLHSARKALERMGADARLTVDPGLVADADGVVLPGVGAFGACMRALRSVGLDEPALDAVASGRPFLGICVGMQMLFDRSEEDDVEPGLGVIPGTVRWIPPGVKIPQMQWNRLHVRRADDPMLSDLGADPWVYFVHSLHGVPDDPGVVAATCEYGVELNAAFRLGNVFATQFHPEKSGPTGLQLLANFVVVCVEARAGSGASA